MNKRFDQIEKQIDRIEAQLENIERKCDAMILQLDNVACHGKLVKPSKKA